MPAFPLLFGLVAFLSGRIASLWVLDLCFYSSVFRWSFFLCVHGVSFCAAAVAALIMLATQLFWSVLFLSAVATSARTKTHHVPARKEVSLLERAPPPASMKWLQSLFSPTHLKSTTIKHTTPCQSAGYPLSLISSSAVVILTTRAKHSGLPDFHN